MAVILSVVALFPTLHNGWLRWDDHAYILSNPLIQQLNWHSVQGIFTAYSFNGGYTPIPMLSWAFDHWLFGMDASHFHQTNLILHLVNMVICYVFVHRLTTNWRVAFFVAILFGLHPMHLEPVAWITGRKDLLLGLFSLVCLLFWTVFVTSGFKNRKWFAMCVFTFPFALLSKATAVILPFWFLLIVVFIRGRLNLRDLLLQIPFVLFSVAFGLLAIWAQQKGEAMPGLSDFSLSESTSWGFQAIGTYLIKLVIPYHVGPFHPYPTEYSSGHIVIGFAACIGIFAYALKIRKIARGKIVLFGGLFLLSGLVLTAQFIPVGFAITADRYTYLPYIGGSLLLVGVVQLIPVVRNSVITKGIALLYIFFLAFQTRVHTEVWKSDLTLWNHEISHHQEAPRAYVNRGQYFLNSGKYEKAIDDFSVAIRQEPCMKEAFQQRGLTYQAVQRYEKAASDFKSAIALDSSYVPAILNLALNDVYTGEVQLAMSQLEMAEAIEPNNILVILNKGVVFEKTGNLQGALKQYTKVITASPQSPQGYRYRGVLYFSQQRFDLAKVDFEAWSKMDTRNPMVFRWLARTNARLGLEKGFYGNAEQADLLGGALPNDEFFELENSLHHFFPETQSETLN